MAETRLTLHTPATAEGKAQEALSDIYERQGEAGPMVRAMANSPALLRGYLDLSRAVKRVKLPRDVTERLSLALQGEIGCGYCLVAHTRAARHFGVDDDEIARARAGTSSDAGVAALIELALTILRRAGSVDDALLSRIRGHGYSDRQIADVVALVALQQMTGSFNQLVGLEPDQAELAAVPEAGGNLKLAA